MGDVDVDIDFKKQFKQFTLASPGASRYPTFLSLCDEIAFYLRLQVSPAELADERRSPFEIIYLDDKGEDFPIHNDLTLHDAIRIPPRDYLRLRLSPVKKVPVKDKKEDDPLANAVLTPSQLVKLFHHLRHHGTSAATEALGAVQQSIRANERDLKALREIRYDLAALIGPFLSSHFPSTEGSVKDEDYAPLQSDLSAMLLENKVSRATTEAAVHSVQAICACRFACDLLRAKYAVVAREGLMSGKKRAKREAIAAAAASVNERCPPVKHYINHYTALLRVAGQNAREAQDNFAQALSSHPADEKAPFTLTRRLCFSLNEAITHFLERHVKKDTLEFKKKSLRKLQKNLVDKLTCAGFNDVLVEPVSRLIEALARDQEVLKKIREWATKPITWDSVSAREAEDEEDEHGRQVPDEIDREIWESRMRRSRRRSQSRESWARDEWDRRRSHSRRRDEDDRWRSRSRRRDDSVGSRRGRHSPHRRSRVDVSMDRPNPFDGGPLDNLPVLGKEANSESDTEASSDTARSQWARVQHDKEQERARLHRLLQIERDRRFGRHVSRTYGRERVARRRDDAWSRHDHGQSWVQHHHGQSWGERRPSLRQRLSQGWSRRRGSRDREHSRTRQALSRSPGRGWSRERSREQSRERSWERPRSRGRGHSRERSPSPARPRRRERGRSRERRHDDQRPSSFGDFVDRAEADFPFV